MDDDLEVSIPEDNICKSDCEEKPSVNMCEADISSVEIEGK